MRYERVYSPRRETPESVIFRVRDQDLAASLDTINYFPDSYLSWLVAGYKQDVAEGQPIYLDRQPGAFHRLLERTRWGSKPSCGGVLCVPMEST